ncbi:MAG: O-antigen ligase family protein [Candidatus Levybacteria bacterium]|nr:O-antigen ligase family protein [Candidatus Levybacteria bacterium]
MAEKIIKIFFLFLLFLFPFGEIARFDLGNNIAVRVLDVAIGLVLVAWLLDKEKKKRFQKKLVNPILFFTGALFVSLFLNMKNYQGSEIIISSLYFLRWIVYAGLYFVVADFDIKFKSKIRELLVVIGAMVVVLGYVQYFLYPNLRNLYYLGWDEHLYRMFSTFLDPNFAGTFFVLYLLFLSGLFWNSYKEKQYRSIQIYGGLFVLTFCAILLTFSRGAFIMFFVSMGVFLMQIKKARLLFGIAVLSIIFLGLVSRFNQSEGTNLFRTTSNLARIESVNRAITIFLDNPIFGVGFNNYRYAKLRYGFTSKSKYEDHAGAGTDNSFLFVLATTGIIGFSAYVYLWYSIVRNLRNIVITSSLVGLFVNALFINSLFYPFIMAWVWILLGITEKT